MLLVSRKTSSLKEPPLVDLSGGYTISAVLWESNEALQRVFVVDMLKAALASLIFKVSQRLFSVAGGVTMNVRF